MSSFTTARLVVSPHTAKKWEVVEPFTWYEGSSLESAYLTVTVPAGFITDFDSTPWFAKVFLWFLLRGRHRGRRAACLHDFCYQLHPLKSYGYEKADYDDMYWEAMLVEGVPDKTAGRMRAALNTGISRSIWRDYRGT